MTRAIRDPSPRPHLFGMLPQELAANLRERGVPCEEREALRVMGHVVSLGHDDLALRKPPRKAVLAGIDEHFERTPLEVVERAKDDYDGFVKYLFRHPDGALTEAVRIPLEKEGRFTVCLSSQVGCAMQCVFCATGKLGLTRNLAAWEMVSALRTIAAEVREEGRGRVSGVVFMGQGEPFHNYDEVIRAARVLQNPCGGRIAAENITISTVGLVPQIKRYVAEDHPYRLIVSLTSALPDKRARLLPVAGRIPMDELVEALQEAHRRDGKRVTLAWVLMGGVNHGDDELDAIRARFEGLPLRINIVDLNAVPEVDVIEGAPARRATDEARDEFVRRLRDMGIATIRRYSGGSNEHAACGMLSARHQRADSAVLG